MTTQNDGHHREELFRLAVDMLGIANMNGYFQKVNPAFTTTLGYTEEQIVARPFLDFVHPEDKEGTLAELAKLSKGETTLRFENRYICRDGTYKWLSWKAVPNVEEQLIYATARDVTDRKRAHDDLERLVSERTRELAETVQQLEFQIEERTLAEQEAKRQLSRVASLRKIDRAILGSVDVNLALNVFVEEVMRQLEVDAVAVLLPNPATDNLEYAAGRGFRTDLITRTSVRLGTGHAGRAALDNERVQFLAKEDIGDFCRTDLIEAEEFESYVCVPLEAKARVSGVVEVYNRCPLNPNEDWNSFLETLAGQAAIAIDSATMLRQLERSNLELRVAYDATLEGWVKALDLRDHETEGHALRVTELTVRLAKRLGVPEEQLIHIRRGALLHDIGKIGIPDHILLKPGKLMDEEMEHMKLHAVYAFQWLSPIRYLAGALDIPYCHHEKWDGTGYPRGLKGEAIPFAARLFAVIDVWDALRSDRPYRAAWPMEKVLAHIREQSGTHFDPAVAEEFLQMIAEEQDDESLPLAA